MTITPQIRPRVTALIGLHGKHLPHVLVVVHMRINFGVNRTEHIFSRRPGGEWNASRATTLWRRRRPIAGRRLTRFLLCTTYYYAQTNEARRTNRRNDFFPRGKVATPRTDRSKFNASFLVAGRQAPVQRPSTTDVRTFALGRNVRLRRRLHDRELDARTTPATMHLDMVEADGRTDGWHTRTFPGRQRLETYATF